MPFIVYVCDLVMTVVEKAIFIVFLSGNENTIVGVSFDAILRFVQLIPKVFARIKNLRPLHTLCL